MGNILHYIAKETHGDTFTSYKYCYDWSNQPHIEYDSSEDSYVNLKDYAEDVHDPNMRDLRRLAEMKKGDSPLFAFFLDGSRKVYKIDDIQYDKKVYPILSGQISVACCGRTMSDDIKFSSFRRVDSECYSVVCLPVSANSEGIENSVFFNRLLKKINDQLSSKSQSKAQLQKLLALVDYTVANLTL